MARSFASASTQYLSDTTITLSAEPITLAAWGYPLANNVGCVLLSLSRSAAADGRYFIAFGSTGVVTANKENNTGTGAGANSTASYSANAWSHVGGVFINDSSRYAYLNGVRGAEVTTNISDPTIDSAVVGAYLPSTGATLLMNGRVAHAAIWNVALSEAEFADLYNNGIGADPRSIRPDALFAYWPLLNNDGDQDYWGNFHLTATNSPTYAKHPPVLMRSRPRYVILGAGAPSIATIDIAGTRQVGNTLTCNATSSPSGATFTYQWYMADDILGTNQTAISGATSQTYELSYANIGAATKLYEGLDANGEAFIACGATPTKDAVTGDETVSSYVSITEASVTAPVGSPFESRYIR